MKRVIRNTAIVLAVAALICSQLVLLVGNLKLNLMNSQLQDTVERQKEEDTGLYLLLDNLQNSGLETVPITDTLSAYLTGPLLVCRISEYNCGECVDFAVRKMIEEHKNEGLEIPMLLLGNYSSMSALKALAWRLDPESECLLGLEQDNGLPIESHNVPYYYILNGNCTVQDVFVPDRMEHELADTYFSILSRKWNAAEKE